MLSYTEQRRRKAIGMVVKYGKSVTRATRKPEYPTHQKLCEAPSSPLQHYSQL